MGQQTPVNNYGPGDTLQIGGDRFAFWSQGGLTPQGFGPVIANASYAVPSVPPVYGTPGADGTIQGTGGMIAAQQAQASPFSLQKSALPWAALGLVAGLFAVHKVAWKGE